MPKILFGFSPIGLGHATRALVLAEELRKGGAEVRLFSGGKAADFVREQGQEVDDIVDDPVPSVSNGVMRWTALWYIRSWLAYKRTMRRTEQLFDVYSPDIVIGDEEFTGMEVARRRGRQRVFISDELMLGFGRTWLSKKIEARVEKWYRQLQRSVDLLIIPDEGADTGNMRHVGPIVRGRTSDCESLRRKYHLPNGKMILFSMSGSGIGEELLRRTVVAMSEAHVEGAFLAVTGNRGKRVTGQGVFDLGLVPDNQDLVGCADLVISLAGKSTIDEANAAGTPIVVIPIKNHAEQERNAADLGYNYRDSSRLAELIRTKIGQRGPAKKFAGETEASRLILSLS